MSTETLDVSAETLYSNRFKAVYTVTAQELAMCGKNP